MQEAGMFCRLTLIFIVISRVDYIQCQSVNAIESCTPIKQDEKGMSSIIDVCHNFLTGIAEEFSKHPNSKIDDDRKQQFEDGSKHSDVNLNITQLITKYGYPVQEHTVTTEDGYLLNIHRIPKNGAPIVFVMHGVQSCSDDWITSGPKDGLGYILYDAGYDVWLGNNRGNKHALGHINLTPDCKEFWDFSFEEMGRYDLPATIDYILDISKHTNLTYIGHSQGTTNFFVMASEKPEYNKKISLMISLASIAWIANAKSLGLKQAAPETGIFWDILKSVGIYSLMVNDPVSDFLKKTFCSSPVTATLFCITPMFTGSGFDYQQLNYTRLPTILSHTGAGQSVKQAVHFGQLASSGKFRQFDYGLANNLALYGSIEPPDYALDKITAPVAIFFSLNDLISDYEDVQILLRHLPNVVEKYQVPRDKFNHIDYLYAKDTNSLIYCKILRLLKNKYTQKNEIP